MQHELLSTALIIAAYLLFLLWAARKWKPMRQAYIAWAAGKMREVVEFAEKAIANFPKEPDAYLMASSGYLGLSQPEKAMDMARKALFLDPKNAAAYNNCALAEFQMNQFQNALDACDKALELARNGLKQILASVYVTRGSVYGALGEMSKAIADSNEALLVDSTCLAALINRAYSYSVLQQFDRALADLEALAQLSLPIMLKAFLFSNKARIHLATGNMLVAHEDSIAALNLFPDIPAILSTRGLVLMRDGKLEEALPILSKAIEVDRYYAEAYWFRHELYETIGEFDKAASDKLVAEGYCYRPYI